MRIAKHKRKLFQKLPAVFLTLVVLSVFFVGFYLILGKILNNNYFLSPLAKFNIYKTNSIESYLQKSDIPFEKVETATDSSYIIFLRDQGLVNISPNKDIPLQISSLQLILSRLTIEGKKFKRLDLRFDKPIIQF